MCIKCKQTHPIASYTGKNPYCRECRSAIQKTWYEKNKERKKEQCRLLYEKNKEQIRKRHRDYNAQNREKVRQCTKEWYRAALKGEKGETTLLKIKLKLLVKNVFKGMRFSKISKTAEMVGCSYDELLTHLGSKPTDNHHLDHICPCSQAQSPEELVKLQHYSNLRWLPAEENMSKSDNKTSEGELMCLKLLGRGWINE